MFGKQDFRKSILRLAADKIGQLCIQQDWSRKTVCPVCHSNPMSEFAVQV